MMPGTEPEETMTKIIECLKNKFSKRSKEIELLSTEETKYEKILQAERDAKIQKKIYEKNKEYEELPHLIKTKKLELESLKKDLDILEVDKRNLQKFKEGNNNNIAKIYINNYRIKQLDDFILDNKNKILEKQKKMMNEAITVSKTYGIEHDNRTVSDFTNNEVEKLYELEQKYEIEMNKLMNENKSYLEYLSKISLDELEREKTKYMEKIKETTENINFLITNIDKVRQEIKVIKKIIVHEKFRPEYIKYAKLHGIINGNQKIESLYELVSQCNKHRQHFLLYENNNGSGFKFKCCSDCNGHWTGNKNTWEAGGWCRYKMNSPDQWSLTYYDKYEKKELPWDTYDISQFNIHRKEPMPMISNIMYTGEYLAHNIIKRVG